MVYALCLSPKYKNCIPKCKRTINDKITPEMQTKKITKMKGDTEVEITRQIIVYSFYRT